MTNTNCTPANPTGITNYDIGPFAHIPEWQALAQALNNYALAANMTDYAYDDDNTVSQDALATAVAHLARGIAFMDCCPHCERRLTDDTSHIDTSAAPYATHIDGDWLLGRYRCAAGHEWNCSYALYRGGW